MRCGTCERGGRNIQRPGGRRIGRAGVRARPPHRARAWRDGDRGFLVVARGFVVAGWRIVSAGRLTPGNARPKNEHAPGARHSRGVTESWKLGTRNGADPDHGVAAPLLSIRPPSVVRRTKDRAPAWAARHRTPQELRAQSEKFQATMAPCALVPVGNRRVPSHREGGKGPRST